MTCYIKKQDIIIQVSHNRMLRTVKGLNAFLEHVALELEWIDEMRASFLHL